MYWPDKLEVGDLVQKGDVQYTFMGIDKNGLYELYSVPYKLTRDELERWCKPVRKEDCNAKGN